MYLSIFLFQTAHLNVLTKVDLLNKQAKKQLDMFLDPDIFELLASEHNSSNFNKK